MLSKKEAEILLSIHVASENDPLQPEFPSDDPKFPATPTRKIAVSGFSDVWLKDESKNPTGTHKDRMAWEMVVTYRDFLLAKQRGQTDAPLPSLSIISSGSAAFAIQTQLRKYQLPSLRVLVDNSINKKVLKTLKEIGCHIYEADLSEKALSSEEILELTDNVKGFDITSNEALDPTTRFYDWLSYEIINSSPEYCFIPFGTGNLYENVLNITKKEVSSDNHDPRFSGDSKTLRNCHFIGATTNDMSSKADKLYSPHLPFVHFGEQWIRFYRYAGFCGDRSDVHIINEQCLERAYDILQTQEVDCEYSAAASLGMLIQLQDTIPQDAKILIVSTGKTKY